MKKIYSLVFVITLMLTLGIISDVKAVHLSNQIGRITITRNVTVVHNPVTNTFSYAILFKLLNSVQKILCIFCNQNVTKK